MYDLIIIGSGPAGLSAAVYGVRAGLHLLVLEKNAMSGGQITNTEAVDNYLGLPGIGGFEMGMKFREHADKMGAAFQKGEVVSVQLADKGKIKQVHLADGTVLESRSLILATGADHALLGAKGEKELKGMGVSYCATCDGAFFKKKEVAVIGGGDTAVSSVLYLAKMCKKVYLIHRRNSLRATEILQDKLGNCDNVEILYNCEVEEICGDGMVESLLLKKKVTETDETEKMQIEVAGVFVNVGMHPNSEPFAKTVACDANGYICAGENCATNIPGICVAGDLRTKKVRQVITAAADGAIAVGTIEAYLH